MTLFSTLLLMLAISSPAPVSAPAVSIVPCQQAFNIAYEHQDMDASYIISHVVDSWIKMNNLTPDQAVTQRMVCQIYFKGQADLIGASGNKS